MRIKNKKIILPIIITLVVLFFFLFKINITEGMPIPNDSPYDQSEIGEEIETREDPPLEKEPEYDEIILTGEGKLRLVPEFAVLYINITTNGKTADEAQKENNWIFDKLIKKLKDIGLEYEGLETLRFILQPININNEKSTFSLSNDFRFKIAKADNFSEIIDTLLSSRITSITKVEFGVNNIEEVRQEVIKRSVNHADEQAEAISKIIGKKLFKTKIIKYEDNLDELDVREYIINISGTEYMAETKIFPGNILVECIVEIKYNY